MPSPNGLWIATLHASSISVKAVTTLDTICSIKLPADLAGGVISFAWSPSSAKILVAVSDQIHILSTAGDNYHGVVRFPSSTVTRPSSINFGPTDSEICAFSTHGMKLSIFNLVTSKTVEISNPKFYTLSTAARGYSFRPRTCHLAVLTRTSGKDMISIHAPENREVQRSWSPDTIDAQGLRWTPDGNWLVVWESSAHGHRVIFFTPDGHVFRDWRGPIPRAGDVDLNLGAGVGLVSIAPNGQNAVIADSSRSVYVLSLPSMTERARLEHPEDVHPKETLQVSEHLAPWLRG